MSIPRQLAPTVGPAHDGVEFLEGFYLGFEEFAFGRMKKRRFEAIIRDNEVMDNLGQELIRFRADSTRF